MINYWTIRNQITGEIKVLSSKKYFSFVEIETKYKGWKIIDVGLEGRG